MIENKSYSRQQYEATYSLMRLHGEEFYTNNKFPDWDEIDECASLSYDYRDSHFSGWVNRQRLRKFLQRYGEVLLGGKFPF